MAARAGLLAVLGGSLFVAIALTRADPPPLAASFFGAFALASYASLAVYFAMSYGMPRWFVVTAAFAAVGGVSIARVAAGAYDTTLLARGLAVGLGAAGLIAYIVACATGSPDDRRRTRLSFGEALILPVAVVQVTFYLWLSIARNPVYDAFILAFERRAHFVIEPVLIAALRWTSFGALATMSYLALPAAFAAMAARQRDPANRLRVLLAALVCGVVGFLCYQICPSTGPRDALGITDAAPLDALTTLTLAPIWTPGQVPRNAMPSLHAAWALLLVLNARSLPRMWRIGTVVFALLNICAAIGRYQHWTMDVIVAVPLGSAVQLAIVSNGRPRTIAQSGICLAMTLVWLIAFRLGAAAALPAAAIWPLLALTVGLPAWLLRESRPKPAGII